jgi:hypothetical protein
MRLALEEISHRTHLFEREGYCGGLQGSAEDGTDSCSCPVVGFGVSGADPSGSATAVVVTCVFLAAENVSYTCSAS